MIVFNSLQRDPRVWKEALSIGRLGATVSIYMVRSNGQPSVQKLSDRVTVYRITECPPTSRRPWQFLLGNLAFIRATLMHPHDVYHCHDGATLLPGFLASRRHAAGLVYDAHEYFPGYAPRRDGPRWKTALAYRLYSHRHFERLFIRQVDQVITVNESIAGFLQSHYKLRSRPTVLRNAIPYWTRSDNGKSLHRLVGISERAPILLYQGMVTPARGLENAICALSHLPGWHFVSLGKGSERTLADLKALAVAEGVQHRVHLHDPVPYEDLLPYTSSATVGVYLPSPEASSMSYLYSLPNKIFEYAVAGIPTVATALPEIAALLERHDCGIVIANPDPPSVGEAVKRCELRLGRGWKTELAALGSQLCWEAEEQHLVELYGLIAPSRP